MKKSTTPVRILNAWYSTPGKLQYYTESNLVYQVGEYKVYKQFEKSYLYTFKNIAINNLVGLNKEYVQALNSGVRPAEAPMCFIYDSANEYLQKGLQLLN